MDTCACPRSFVCMFMVFKKNTNMKFHTCDVVVGSRGVCRVHKGLGESIRLLYRFHYLFIFYLFVSLHPCFRGVPL